MYGKHFESMYEGSMYGAGIAVFAVWGYVISHARSGRIELNPRKLADTLGGEIGEVIGAIEFLMRPDPQSRHKAHEGRRLLKEGEFQYFLPSWEDYQKLRDAADLREYNRLAKRRERAFSESKAGEYGKRRKDGAIGVREASRLGAKAGAGEALRDGLAEQAAELGKGQEPAPGDAGDGWEPAEGQG